MLKRCLKALKEVSEEVEPSQSRKTSSVLLMHASMIDCYSPMDSCRTCRPFPLVFDDNDPIVNVSTPRVCDLYDTSCKKGSLFLCCKGLRGFQYDSQPCSCESFEAWIVFVFREQITVLDLL